MGKLSVVVSREDLKFIEEILDIEGLPALERFIEIMSEEGITPNQKNVDRLIFKLKNRIGPDKK